MTEQTVAAKLEKVIQRIADPDEIARTLAATSFFNLVQSNGLHPSQLHIRIRNVSTQSPLDEQKDHINRQFREIDFWRRYASAVDPLLIQKAIESRDIDYRWGEFEELIRLKVTGDDAEKDELRRGWKTELVELLRVSPSTISRWRKGHEQIPEHAFDTLRMMPTTTQPINSTQNTGRKTNKTPHTHADGRKNPGPAWSQNDAERLIEIIRANPAATTPQLADICTARFGRPIMSNTVKDQIKKLRHNSRIPYDRKGWKNRTAWEALTTNANTFN